MDKLNSIMQILGWLCMAFLLFIAYHEIRDKVEFWIRTRKGRWTDAQRWGAFINAYYYLRTSNPELLDAIFDYCNDKNTKNIEQLKEDIQRRQMIGKQKEHVDGRHD